MPVIYGDMMVEVLKETQKDLYERMLNLLSRISKQNENNRYIQGPNWDLSARRVASQKFHKHRSLHHKPI